MSNILTINFVFIFYLTERYVLDYMTSTQSAVTTVTEATTTTEHPGNTAQYNCILLLEFVFV